MGNEQFDIIQKKLDEINQNIINSHKQHFEWAQVIANSQIKMEKFFNVSERWTPYYNPVHEISPEYPEIFNKYGEKMSVLFMSDRLGAHVPNSKNSRYIIWDRYNYGLPIHFYTHDEMFRIVGKPERKFGLLVESRSIVPQSYENVLKNKDYIEKNFEAVFTFDAQVLSTLKNAQYAPLCATVWYGMNASDNSIMYSIDASPPPSTIILEDNYKRKTKNISMISSDKKFCEGHLRRIKLAFKVKNEKLADTFGKFDGGSVVPIELPFEHYRYSIAVENDITPFYYTEKLLNCFMSQTIPIYLGATRIGEFFNPEGIIQISIEDCDHIEDILKQCTPEEYERRLPAVIDNFNRVKPYAEHTRMDDVYLEYIKKNSEV